MRRPAPYRLGVPLLALVVIVLLALLAREGRADIVRWRYTLPEPHHFHVILSGHTLRDVTYREIEPGLWILVGVELVKPYRLDVVAVSEDGVETPADVLIDEATGETLGPAPLVEYGSDACVFDHMGDGDGLMLGRDASAVLKRARNALGLPCEER